MMSQKQRLVKSQLVDDSDSDELVLDDLDLEFMANEETPVVP
jgi:hypothetical protein